MKNKISFSIIVGFLLLIATGLIVLVAVPRSQTKSLQGNATSLDTVLPNSTLTPGAINTDITQENIGDNICNPNWSTKSERPPATYTTNLKIQQLAGNYAYEGITDTKLVEEDHLISLELGGNPTDPKNLWPEPYNPVPGAKQKDLVENYLHKEVCNGDISLATAQSEISTNWYAVYQTMQSGNLQGVQSDVDPDDN